MSTKHPIIAVTGSSGAGTTTVKHTFEAIFHRENVNAAVVEGDSFHRYTRSEMKRLIEDAERAGQRGISHFGPEANLIEELENLFRAYGESATGRYRTYIHDAESAARSGLPIGSFGAWEDLPVGTDCLFYEGLHGAVVTEKVWRFPDRQVLVRCDWSRLSTPSFDSNLEVSLTKNRPSIGLSWLAGATLC